MKLYHFTSLDRLMVIKAEGLLRVTESNVGSARADLRPYGPHYAPDVVWLTDSIDAQGHGLEIGHRDDKKQVRIEVEVDDAEAWSTFSQRYGMNPVWRAAIEKDNRPESWFVVARDIPRSEWVKVTLISNTQLQGRK
jgi:hypothetical protein